MYETVFDMRSLNSKKSQESFPLEWTAAMDSNCNGQQLPSEYL